MNLIYAFQIVESALTFEQFISISSIQKSLKTDTIELIFRSSPTVSLCRNYLRLLKPSSEVIKFPTYIGNQSTIVDLIKLAGPATSSIQSVALYNRF